MAKSKQRLEARQLRKMGRSIKDIASTLMVSSGSVSIWCRDIALKPDQWKALLHTKTLKTTKGRLAGARMQRRKRLDSISKAVRLAARKIRGLSSKEFYTAGLALYLAEGSKTDGTVEFTNSDPRLVRFMISWFKKFFSISRNTLKCSLILNISHERREASVRKYWQKKLGISSTQFNKTRYSHTTQKKVYDNERTYQGTFNFRIPRGTNLLRLLNALGHRLLTVPRK